MLERSLEYLSQQLGNFTPDTAIILGSGLSGLTSAIENPIVIPYSQIPDFPQTKVVGHEGCFCFGKIGKHQIVCMQGRFHLYEGIEPKLIYAIIHMLKNLGIKQLIVTNASGSLDENMVPGSIMLISDHINFSGQNPLIKAHEMPSFPDMSEAYDSKLREKMHQIAHNHGIKLFEGVYIMVMGPNYETPAEVKLFKSFGARAVGMSTVPEVISAVFDKIKVLGISVISNLGTGLTDKPQTHEDVIATVAKSVATMNYLITQLLNGE